jgi:O-methyltransferase
MKFPKFVREPLLVLARKLGYEVYKSNLNAALYGPIMSYATYSPWNGDSDFEAAYEAIQSHTLVDKYRCYELWSLVDMVRARSGHLIEIGVWRGGTGALIAKRALLSGITDPVFLCDTFSGVVKASPMDATYVGGEHSDTSEHHVEILLQRLELPNARILKGVFPDQSASALENLKFRFCHIDVDVYRSAKDIVEWIWQKLDIGGVIVFDDYGFDTTPGITRFVDEQRKLHDRMIVYNLNGHAIMVKIS